MLSEDQNAAFCKRETLVAKMLACVVIINKPNKLQELWLLMMQSHLWCPKVPLKLLTEAAHVNQRSPLWRVKNLELQQWMSSGRSFGSGQVLGRWMRRGDKEGDKKGRDLIGLKKDKRSFLLTMIETEFMWTFLRSQRYGLRF